MATVERKTEEQEEVAMSPSTSNFLMYSMLGISLIAVILAIVAIIIASIAAQNTPQPPLPPAPNFSAGETSGNNLSTFNTGVTYDVSWPGWTSSSSKVTSTDSTNFQLSPGNYLMVLQGTMMPPSSAVTSSDNKIWISFTDQNGNTYNKTLAFQTNNSEEVIEQLKVPIQITVPTTIVTHIQFDNDQQTSVPTMQVKNWNFQMWISS